MKLLRSFCEAFAKLLRRWRRRRRRGGGGGDGGKRTGEGRRRRRRRRRRGGGGGEGEEEEEEEAKRRRRRRRRRRRGGGGGGDEEETEVRSEGFCSPGRGGFEAKWIQKGLEPTQFAYRLTERASEQRFLSKRGPNTQRLLFQKTALKRY